MDAGMRVQYVCAGVLSERPKTPKPHGVYLSNVLKENNYALLLHFLKSSMVIVRSMVTLGSEPFFKF